MDSPGFTPEENPPADKLAAAALLEVLRKRDLTVAVIIRSCRRPDGRELSNVAIASRVPGATVEQVKRVRAEMEANGGACLAEIQGPPEDEETT